MKKMITLSSIFLCSFAFQSIAQKESRIIAHSGFNHDGSQFNISDTTFYQYSSWARGGDLKSNYISFDDAITYNYDNATGGLIKYKKVLQRFDAINHRSVAIAAYWNKSIGAWEDATTEYYYSTINDSLTGKVEQTWNKTGAVWTNTAQQSYTYDAAQNRTSYTLDYWNNATSSWLGSEKFLYEYNASNNLTKKTYQTWDASTSTWEPVFIDSFAYSSTNKVITFTNILWNKATTSWKYNKQIFYTYNAFDFLITLTESGWDASLGVWYNAQRQLLINDSKGNVIERSTQNWNTTTASWDNFRKQISTFDSKNNPKNIINQRWMDTLSSFMNSEQRGYNYDALSNRLTDVSSLWNTTTNIWDSSIKVTYEYNMHNQKTKQNYENWDLAGFWKHNVGDQLFHYYYEDFSTAINEKTTPKGVLLLYPIPAKNLLNINLKWECNQSFFVRITDQHGRVYKQWNVGAASVYNQGISLAGFSAGHYIIEFSGNKEGNIKQAFTVVN